MFGKELCIDRESFYWIRDSLADAVVRHGIIPDPFFAKFILHEILHNPKKHGDGSTMTQLFKKGDRVLFSITNPTRITEFDDFHQCIYSSIAMGETVRVDFRKTAEEVSDEEGLHGLLGVCILCDEYGIDVLQELEKTPDGPRVRITFSSLIPSREAKKLRQ